MQAATAGLRSGGGGSFFAISTAEWWIVPMVLMGAIFVYLIITSDATGDAPFVYTLF